MKISKIMLMVLVLCLVSILSLSCRSAPEEPEYQVVTVQRGDLTIDVISSGNLLFSYQKELAFEVSGTVGEVLVEVGDSVEEGQILAKLDDTSVISLEEAVTQAEINLEQARISLMDAEENLEEAQNPYTELDVAQAEAAVANATVALEAAQEALEKAENPYTEADITKAELAVINTQIALEQAEENLERAENRYDRDSSDTNLLNLEQKQKELAIAEFDLADAEEALAEIEAGADPLEVEQKQKQLTLAQASLTKAEDDLTELQAEIWGSVDSLEVELMQLEVATAQAALEIDTAQAALDEAIERLEMTTIVAPFNGIVTSVNVEVDEEVNANQVIIELVDPNKFEAEILVNEMDIMQMQVGAPAVIEVEAIAGISLPARVTSISPTAIIQQGVVNYKVAVELESFESLMSELELPALSEEEQQPQATPGSIDQALDKAVKEGHISQQQADMMKERFAQRGGSLTPEQLEQLIEGFSQGASGFGQRGGGFSQEQMEQFRERFPEGAGGFFEQQMGQRPMGIMLEAFQLREGLTVTVSIIIQERNDVLLVPNQAVIYRGQQTFVRVLVELEREEGGTSIEERPVVIGLSDWQNTEITQGLSGGEQVVIPQTTTTSTMPEQQSPSFRMFPGMGGR